MMILGISCSPRRQGNTEILVAEALQGAQGMKAARELGQQMVQLAVKKFEYPSGFRMAHFAYGTHTHQLQSVNDMAITIGFMQCLREAVTSQRTAYKFPFVSSEPTI